MLSRIARLIRRPVSVSSDFSSLSCNFSPQMISPLFFFIDLSFIDHYKFMCVCVCFFFFESDFFIIIMLMMLFPLEFDGYWSSLGANSMILNWVLTIMVLKNACKEFI